MSKEGVINISKQKAGWKLSSASLAGDVEEVTRLLQNGVDVNFGIGNSSGTPLHHAALGGRVGVAELLIKAGAKVDSWDMFRDSPLHKAARGGHVGVAELLIKAGAQLDSRDKIGRTPLNLAALEGHFGVAELLIKAGARMDSRDEKGETPEDKASSEDVPGYHSHKYRDRILEGRKRILQLLKTGKVTMIGAES